VVVPLATGHPRELAFWRLLPFYVAPDTIQFHSVNDYEVSHPTWQYKHGLLRAEPRKEELWTWNHNSTTLAMAGASYGRGGALRGGAARFRERLGQSPDVYGFDEYTILSDAKALYVHFDNPLYERVDFEASLKTRTGPTYRTADSRQSPQASRVPPCDRWAQDYQEWVARVKASVVPPLPKDPFTGLGWEFRQGLPYYPLSRAYRAAEVSHVRHAKATGLHYLDVPKLPPSRPTATLVALVVEVSKWAKKAGGKVVLTASPDGPPPPATLGFLPLALNNKRKDWISVGPATVELPREWAYLRLAALVAPDVTQWWVVNGREVEKAVLPPLVEGRLSSWNDVTIDPLLLMSTTGTWKWSLQEMARWMPLAGVYGVDELALADAPLTVWHPSRSPQLLSTWHFPLDGGWPDAEVYAGGKLLLSGRLNRLTVQKKIRQETLAPRPPASSPKGAGSRARDLWLDRLEELASRQELQEVLDPLDEFPGKAETVLFVTYGTRGDEVPVEYAARVAQAMGYRVALCRLERTSSAQLRAFISGDIKGFMASFVSLFAMGKYGFKGVVMPQVAGPGNTVSYELTAWQHTAAPVFANVAVTAAVNMFIRAKRPLLLIGAMTGCNFPRSANGKTRLRFYKGRREPRVGWVAGSDGLEAVPEEVRKLERITDPDHEAAFRRYTEVWCAGGQGTVQTILAAGAKPLVYAPGFDRVMVEGTEHCLYAPDFTALAVMMRHLTGQRSSFWHGNEWLAWLKFKWLALDPWDLVRAVLFLYHFRQLPRTLPSLLASFPELLSVLRYSFLSMPAYALALVFRYPVLVTYAGVPVTMFLVTVFNLVLALSKLRLAARSGTYLAVKVVPTFPYVEHVMVKDVIARESLEMQWQGNRKNLRNPFRGVVKHEWATQHFHRADEVWIPLPVNYPEARRRMLSKAGQYSPWFNCHTTLPDVTDYAFLSTTLVVVAQLAIFPVTAAAFLLFLFRKNFTCSFADLPPDSFFRYGTTKEYADLAAELLRAEEAQALVTGLVTATVADQVVPAVVEGKGVALNAVHDPLTAAPTVEEEARRWLDEHPPEKAPALEEYMMHAAALAEHAKEQGCGDLEAYHCAVLALHDALMALPEPKEVVKWRQKWVPAVEEGLNQPLQRLSKYLSSSLHKLPAGVRAVLSKLYLWLEGVGAKLKTYAFEVYHLLAWAGDRLAEVSLWAWEEFSAVVTPFIDHLFDRGLARRLKTVWALGGVAKNPAMAAQRRLQEHYALATYERTGVFEKDYYDAIEDIKSHLPPKEWPRDDPGRLFKNSRFKDRTKGLWVKAPSDVAGIGGTQYRPVRCPGKPVMSAAEAEAVFGDEWEKKAWEDVYLTDQVNARLQRGATQHVDHMWEVDERRDPGQVASVMFRMQERYAYYGLEFDPTEEPIPPLVTDQQQALYDDIARRIVAKWPEKYGNRKVTAPEALMNYLEWDRGSGPMFENSARGAHERHALPLSHNASQNQLNKRWKMWEAGLGYAVLKKCYADATNGKVDVQQFSAFVKSQPTPKDKLARGVTFMPLTQWFKGMMECFAQNQRVTYRTTYVGKNMPLNQHMSDFFERVRKYPVKMEGDARQMDSRFQDLQLYGLGRIAYHAWTEGSPLVDNGAAIASHKQERYRALADGWIFNLHVRKGIHPMAVLKTSMAHPNAARYSNVTAKRRGGATGLEDTTDLNTDAKKLMTVAALVEFGQMIGKPVHPSDVLDETKFIEVHTSDDNMKGIDVEKLYGITVQQFHDLQPQFIEAFARHQLDMTFIFHEDEGGRWLEYLSHFSRPLTVEDRRTLDRVNTIYRAKGIFTPEQELTDPITSLPPTHVVYQNTKAMDGRQTANNAYKQYKFRDRYLLALVARDAGQAQLKAHNAKSYLHNVSVYTTNAVRYLAAAAFPDTCRNKEGIAQWPSDEKELAFVKAHLHLSYEDVVCRMPVIRVDKNVVTRLWPREGGPPAEFRARLQDLSEAKMAAYSKIVRDHYKASRTPANKADIILGKINKGVLGADEAFKDVVDLLRREVEKLPRKLTRGVTPSLDMIYPDEIWDGSGYVEAVVYLAEEEDSLRVAAPVTSEGFNRRLNQSPYAGCCNGAAAFYRFSTPEGRAQLHAHPKWVYQNMTCLVSVLYSFFWFVERWILRLPFIGLAWALMMFYLIDVTKIYAVGGLLFWHWQLKASPVISGLLPRDVYIHSKRFSDWVVGLLPIGLGYLLRFDAFLAWGGWAAEQLAKFWQHGMHVTPMTSTQPGRVQNEWESIAAEAALQMAASPLHVASVEGPTGTGKSTFLVYALMRLNLLERGGILHLVAPYETLRDDWSLPSWFALGSHDSPEEERNSLYQQMDGKTQLRPNTRIALWTYGSFHGAIEREVVKQNDVVCLDESHLGGPAQVLSAFLLQDRGIWSLNLSATPAPVKGLEQGYVIDATSRVTKKHRSPVVEFPASTSAVTMLQQMRNATEVDERVGFSHKDMSERLIVSIPSTRQIAKFVAAVDELRKSDPSLPRVYEFSRATVDVERKEREAYMQGGKFILAATRILAVGYDVKPAAYAVIDTGHFINEHQGQLTRAVNSTHTQMQQLHGRVGRNSSDRPGLVYCTENAGTGTPSQEYGSPSYYVHGRVANAIGVPALLPLPWTGLFKSFNYFDILPEFATDPVQRHSLRFALFAALSGVMERDLPGFYALHAEEGHPLPRHYEWMEGHIAATLDPALGMLPWPAVYHLLQKRPYEASVQSNQVTDSQEGRMPQTRRVSLVYPRASKWRSYQDCLRMSNMPSAKANVVENHHLFKQIVVERQKELDEAKKLQLAEVAGKSNTKPSLATQVRTQRAAGRLAGANAAKHHYDSLTENAAVQAAKVGVAAQTLYHVDGAQVVGTTTGKVVGTKPLPQFLPSLPASTPERTVRYARELARQKQEQKPDEWEEVDWATKDTGALAYLKAHFGELARKVGSGKSYKLLRRRGGQKSYSFLWCDERHIVPCFPHRRSAELRGPSPTPRRPRSVERRRRSPSPAVCPQPPPPPAPPPPPPPEGKGKQQTRLDFSKSALFNKNKDKDWGSGTNGQGGSSKRTRLDSEVTKYLGTKADSFAEATQVAYGAYCYAQTLSSAHVEPFEVWHAMMLE